MSCNMLKNIIDDNGRIILGSGELYQMEFDGETIPEYSAIEVEDNRDRTSKHFRLSDGTIMAADYGMDVHYEKDGAWKDIDNRLIYEAPTAADAKWLMSSITFSVLAR